MMPFVPRGDEEREDALKAKRADFKWALADNEVSEEVQGANFAGGFCKLSTFVGLGETKTE
eukprot:6243970-Karenia_brevis.AAC.1